MRRGAAHGKRVQAMGGAKNHGIVLPDADLDQAVKDLVGAAFGSAGERCMALPVVVPVGEKTADALREKLLAEIETLKVGVSTDPTAQYGPVVTAAHKQRIEDYIQLGVDEGAELVVDGRGFTLQGYEKGFFIGPTPVRPRASRTCAPTRRRSSARCCRSSAPTASRRRCALPSEHQYGNGVAIFTRNGRAAREFAARVNVGMVGHQRADPGAGRLPHLRRLEALGLRRHQPARHGGGAFYTKVKTVTAALAGRRHAGETAPSSSRPWGERSIDPLVRRGAREVGEGLVPDATLSTLLASPSPFGEERAGPRMTHFDLTDDQRAIEETARAFAADAIAPHAARWDEEKHLPASTSCKAAAALGFGGDLCVARTSAARRSAGSTRRSSSRRWPMATSPPPPSSRSTTWPRWMIDRFGSDDAAAAATCPR